MALEISPKMQNALDEVRQQYEINKEFTEGLSSLSTPGQGIEIENEAEAEVERVRRFGEIARSSPQNAKEQDILIQAQLFLSPEEFQECVYQNSSTQEIEHKVGMAEMYDEIRKVMVRQEELERQMKEQEILDERSSPVEKDPLSLGDEFGVMEKIAEALKEANIIEGQDDRELSAPNTPEKEGNKEKEMER